MNLFAAASAPGCTVRNVVVKSSTLVYGCHARGPDVVHRGHAPSRAARARRSSAASTQVEGYVRDFAEDNPHVTVSLLRFANVIGDEIVTPLTRALRAAAGAVAVRLRPALPVRPRGRRDPLDPVRARAQPGRRLQRRRRRAAAVVRGRRDLRRSAPIAAAAVRHLDRRSGRCSASASSTCPRSTCTLLRYGRGVDNRKLKEPGSTTSTRRPRPCRRSSRRSDSATPSATTSRPTATSATSSSSSGTPPPSSATPVG